MIAAFKVSKESKLASLLIITSPGYFDLEHWYKSAQNIVATNFINQNLGHDVSWENGSYITMVYPYVNRVILYHDESDAA